MYSKVNNLTGSQHLNKIFSYLVVYYWGLCTFPISALIAYLSFFYLQNFLRLSFFSFLWLFMVLNLEGEFLAIFFMISYCLFISSYLWNSALIFSMVTVLVGMIALIIHDVFNAAWISYLFKNLKTGLIKNLYLSIFFFMSLPFFINFINPLFFKIFIDEKFIGNV